MAKGLGGGFPIGGILGVAELFDTFSAGTHGTTFGGNPLAVAVAQSVIDTIFDEKFLQQVNAQSKYFVEQLTSQLPDKFTVQGKGLMLGLYCDGVDVAPIITQLDEAGLLTVSAGPKVIRLLPPLTVSKEEIDEAVCILKKVLEKAFLTNS